MSLRAEEGVCVDGCGNLILELLSLLQVQIVCADRYLIAIVNPDLAAANADRGIPILPPIKVPNMVKPFIITWYWAFKFPFHSPKKNGLAYFLLNSHIFETNCTIINAVKSHLSPQSPIVIPCRILLLVSRSGTRNALHQFHQ
jgi:hypothetical protein